MKERVVKGTACAKFWRGRKAYRDETRDVPERQQSAGSQSTEGLAWGASEGFSTSSQMPSHEDHLGF